jgi:hypothetical protein
MSNDGTMIVTGQTATEPDVQPEADLTPADTSDALAIARRLLEVATPTEAELARLELRAGPSADFLADLQDETRRTECANIAAAWAQLALAEAATKPFVKHFPPPLVRPATTQAPASEPTGHPGH